MTKLLIFTGEIPRNPYLLRDWFPSTATGYSHGQLSILNQCVEVDIDRLQYLYDLNSHGASDTYMPFSQFIQEQINSSNNSNSSQEAHNVQDS